MPACATSDNVGLSACTRRRVTRRLFICLALLTAPGTSSILSAQSGQDESLPAPRVIFGGSGFYPPFHFYNDDGDADGFDVSIFNRVAQLNGWRTAFRLEDWQNVQQALSAGEIDIVPMFVSADRQARYLFSNPLHLEYHLLFGPATSKAYDAVSALTTERIAAEGGAYATAEILKTNPLITVVNAESESDALTMIDQGLADLALLPAEIGRYTLRTRQLDHLAALSPPLLPVTYAFAINPARPELVPLVNASIEQLQRQGILATLRNQWLFADPHDARERALLIVSWTLPLLLALAAAVLLIIKFYRLRLEEMQAHMLGQDVPARAESLDNSSVQSFSVQTRSGLSIRKQIQHQLDYEITVAKHQRSTRGFALISLLNLDALQDAFDEEAGDELIQSLELLIPDDWRAHCGNLSNAVFGFILENAENAEHSVNALLRQLTQSVLIRDMRIHPQLCAGLALYPDHANTATELIHKARMAMNQAKRAGHNLLVYHADIKPDPRRIPVISDLRLALAQHQLQWALQPQFKVEDARIYGAEVLARWHHHQHGWLPPADFIVWAEEAGLISQVTDLLIDETVSLFEAMTVFQGDFYLSINLSAYDLGNDRLIDSIIHKIRQEHAGNLTLEVTETALMRDKKAAMRNIDRLKAAHFRVALDDFGTGYASLEYLQSFNFDEIKIDRRFINNMTSVERDRKLTRASIELGHQLGSTVVAEGVENHQTAAMLIDMGCDVLQGYQIGEPELLGDFNSIRQAWRQVTL